MHTSKTQNIARIVLGAFLTFAGISHLTFNRSEFLAQVPQWLPVSPDLTVILSGIVEISLGLSLIFIVKNKKMGWHNYCGFFCADLSGKHCTICQ